MSKTIGLIYPKKEEPKIIKSEPQKGGTVNVDKNK